MEGNKYEFNKDRNDADQKSGGSENGRERVDIFGELGTHIGGKASGNAPDGEKIKNLPVKYAPKKEKPRTCAPKSRASVMTMAATVLLLTTAFTALAYSAAAGMGSDPWDAAGGIAGELIFGAAVTSDGLPANADPMTSDTVAVSNSEESTAQPSAAEESSGAPTESDAQTEAGAPSESSAAGADPETSAATPALTYAELVNKTGLDLSLDALVEKWGGSVISDLKGTGVMVVCTHPSECFADGTSVGEAAEAFCQALNAVGINAVRCEGNFDESGRLGSYSRARAAIEKMLAEGGCGLVVDLHIGDVPGLLVGANKADADDKIWQRNTVLAAMVNDELNTYRGSVTLDNGRYNQDLPVLSLHAELDGSLSASRGLRSSRLLADSIIRLMKK